jgi:5-aminopentanamidase
MRIACVQTEPLLGQTSRNVEDIEKWIRAVDADLLVFPELATSGYNFPSSQFLDAASFSIESQLIADLGKLCAETRKSIIFGFPEEANGNTYNSAVALDFHGKLVGHYRKVHLFFKETQLFCKGDLGFPVFPLDTASGQVKVGMMICYDWRFPEAARALALAGAELIAVPSNIVTNSPLRQPTFQVRAFENKVYLAFADRVGTEGKGGDKLLFRGESALISYNGQILKQASSDNREAIVAEITPSETRTKSFNQYNDILKDRRPDQY